MEDLDSLADPVRAKNSAWFFKTGPGQYGEGDKFIGITVPAQRAVAKKYKDLPLTEIDKLLRNPIHEYRLTGFMLLVYKFEKADSKAKKEIFDFYLAHTACANNWDLVDSSAGYIIGAWLSDKPKERKILYKFAKSKNLWERRIAIISTQALIKNNDFADTFAIAELLLSDTHDLIHKAVGWMLREVGKRDLAAEEIFLKKHYKIMPRTMLRYAIEKFPEWKRKFYLAQTPVKAWGPESRSE